MSTTTATSGPSFGYKERRREAHTQAEQKRRDAIKKGYEDLQYMVPTCQQQDSISSYKLSKATILQRSIEYIKSLQKSKLRQENELKKLRKEVCALQIMKNNYEQMLKQHQLSTAMQNAAAAAAAVSAAAAASSSASGLPATRQGLHPSAVPAAAHQPSHTNEQVKIEIFQAICDSLFVTFDQYVTFGDFKQLSASIFGWLEEHCKPHTLRDICLAILRDFFTVPASHFMQPPAAPTQPSNVTPASAGLL